MSLRKTVPALPVRSIVAARAFYRDRLGFSAGHHDDRFAIVTRDDVELHLWAAFDETWKNRPVKEGSPVTTGAESFLAGTSSCRIEVDDIDDLYKECRFNEVLYDETTVVEHQPWGTREFAVLDQDGNLITFVERTRG